MNLCKIKIASYRTIKNIELNLSTNSTLIVGKNNIGKSNVLKALNLFFINLNSNATSPIISEEEFRHNTERCIVELHFNNINDHLAMLLDNIKNHRKKRKVNLKLIKPIELNYYQLKRIMNRFSKIGLKLEIRRNQNSKNFTLIDSIPTGRDNKYRNSIRKRYLFEKYFPALFKTKINSNDEPWDFYLSLVVKELPNNELLTTYNNESKTITYSDNEIKDLDNDKIEKDVIEYIRINYKFLYIPAYRGGKQERETILDRLFDIIIEDLVTTKGVTKDYDAISDAIWGSGKNSNRYNLNRIIDKRITELVNNLAGSTIKTIQNVEFESLPQKEIRRQILRIMMGKPKLYLNDGIKTSFESKGTGIQSSFMITLMKSLSEFEYVNSRSILLVVEEPEAFTHPQLTREIIDLMISKKSNKSIQFILTTHSPIIVKYMKAECIIRLSERKVSKKQKETINLNNYNLNLKKEDWALINRISDMDMSEIVFADYVILVEGEADKIVFEMLLKEIIPNEFHRLSIVSISGNNQIFKFLNLFKHFSIKWLLIIDKDSFIEKKFDEEDTINLANIDDFFVKFQIGSEFKDNFRNVLNNQLIDNIKVKSNISSGVKYGNFIKKIKDITPISDTIKNSLYPIISEKIDDEFISFNDELSITQKLNNVLTKNNIPLFCMISDLEGFVINDSTYDLAAVIIENYFKDAYKTFEQKVSSYTRIEKIRKLRSFIGSKTSSLNKVGNAAKSRKKPYIPIEIIDRYMKTIENEKDKQNIIISDFPLLSMLKELIESNVAITNLD